MTPALNAYEVPPFVLDLLGRLRAPVIDQRTGAAAADLITALVAQGSPELVIVCLETNTARRAGVTVGLSPSHAVIMHWLAEHFPKCAGVGDMHRALWGSQTRRSRNTVRVMVSDLRKRIAPLKVAIVNQNGHGYRLDLLPINP